MRLKPALFVLLIAWIGDDFPTVFAQEAQAPGSIQVEISDPAEEELNTAFMQAISLYNGIDAPHTIFDEVQELSLMVNEDPRNAGLRERYTEAEARALHLVYERLNEFAESRDQVRDAVDSWLGDVRLEVDACLLKLDGYEQERERTRADVTRKEEALRQLRDIFPDVTQVPDEHLQDVIDLKLIYDDLRESEAFAAEDVVMVQADIQAIQSRINHCLALQSRLNSRYLQAGLDQSRLLRYARRREDQRRRQRSQQQWEAIAAMGDALNGDYNLFSHFEETGIGVDGPITLEIPPVDYAAQRAALEEFWNGDLGDTPTQSQDGAGDLAESR